MATGSGTGAGTAGATADGFFDWKSFIGGGTEPTSWISRQISEHGKKWDAVKKVSTDTLEVLKRKYDTYNYHVDEANKIRTMRLERAETFLDTSSKIDERIKDAKSEVLAEIDDERKLITASYRAAVTAGNFGERTKAAFTYLGQIIRHKVGLKFTVGRRTRQKQEQYRDNLKQLARNHRDTDKLLKEAQGDHRRSRWGGEKTRPSSRAKPGPAPGGSGGPAPSP